MKANISRTLGLASRKFAAVLIFFGALFICGCESDTPEEVLRVTSPDGKVDAIVMESDCGAVCSVVDRVWLAPKGASGREDTAEFEAPLRNEHDWGVGLRWKDGGDLSIEYLRADYSKILKQTVSVAGERVTVSLVSGISSPAQP